MRVWLSGGSGFVGGHLKDAFDDVLAPSHAEVDVTDAEAVRRSVGAYEPDVDRARRDPQRLRPARARGLGAYVGATRNLWRRRTARS